MSKDPLSEAIGAAGGQSALARTLGVSYQAINFWKKHGTPGPRVLGVEAASGGTVSRHDLRPDIFGPPPITPQAPAGDALGGRAMG